MAVMEAERVAADKPTCRGQKRDGSRCGSTIIDAEGMCFAHGSGATKLAEQGRKGGQKSATVRRARRESQAKEIRSARGLLTAEFATDEAFRKALLAAYKDGLHAKEASERRQTAEAIVNQIDGKPQQNISAKHEYQITVVSRLDEVLTKAADIELSAADVRELEA
jgi:phosphopantetheinyl transferase (holo-ACP synthase)